jgi:uncharacterized protein (TIGR00645 family)
MRTILDKAILASRHILVVFYIGLAVALALYAVRFGWKVWKFALGLFEMEDNDLLLGLLYLLDSALVAALVVMVAISSYDNLVSRLASDAEAQGIDWVAEGVDPGNLKIKLATAIVAISSIHLLQIFLRVGDYDDRAITWGLAIHAVFLAGGICLAVMDRLEGTTKAARKAAAVGSGKRAAVDRPPEA